MKTFITPVILAATLIFGQLATAQEAAEGEDTTTAEEPTTDDGLNLGEPVTPEPAPELTRETAQTGQAYTADRFGDWSLRCLRAEGDAADPCQLYQLLTGPEGNAVAEITMFALPPGGRAAAGATIVAPLETLLTEQLTLRVDGGEARRYPFTFCNVAGCVARVGFTTEEVNQFKRGNEATLTLRPAGQDREGNRPDQINLTVSLSGFTAAYDNTVGE